MLDLEGRFVPFCSRKFKGVPYQKFWPLVFFLLQCVSGSLLQLVIAWHIVFCSALQIIDYRLSITTRVGFGFKNNEPPSTAIPHLASATLNHVCTWNWYALLRSLPQKVFFFSHRKWDSNVIKHKAFAVVTDSREAAESSGANTTKEKASYDVVITCSSVVTWGK